MTLRIAELLSVTEVLLKYRPVLLEWDYSSPDVVKDFFQLIYHAPLQDEVDSRIIIEHAHLADYVQFTSIDQILYTSKWQNYISMLAGQQANGFVQLCSLWTVPAFRKSLEDLVVHHLHKHADIYLELAPLEMIRDYIDRSENVTEWVRHLISWHQKHPASLSFEQFKDMIKPISWHFVDPTVLVHEIEPLGLIDSDTFRKAFRLRFPAAKK